MLLLLLLAIHIDDDNDDQTIDTLQVLQLTLMLFIGATIAIMFFTCFRALFLAFYQNFINDDLSPCSIANSNRCLLDLSTDETITAAATTSASKSTTTAAAVAATS